MCERARKQAMEYGKGDCILGKSWILEIMNDGVEVRSGNDQSSHRHRDKVTGGTGIRLDECIYKLLASYPRYRPGPILPAAEI